MTTELDDKTLAEIQDVLRTALSVEVGGRVDVMLNDHIRARDERDKEATRAATAEHGLAAARAVILKMAAYIRSRAGHEENCHGWRRPLEGKAVPAGQRRGEWMDLDRCTCGPGALLKLAARVAL